MPALFEVGEQALLDFGCHVGVGLDDAVVEVVAESACLGDLGCAAGDEPGFVAVAQAVEGQAWSDGLAAGYGVGGVGVAVGRGAQRRGG
ncbi:hypothetical protein L3Q67_38235 [Saccharothrix sp. AJ9571]|nr:hypothetical protein L3Q67_38235 [Saccharothrix sp. AJ9571]